MSKKSLLKRSNLGGRRGDPPKKGFHHKVLMEYVSQSFCAVQSHICQGRKIVTLPLQSPTLLENTFQMFGLNTFESSFCDDCDIVLKFRIVCVVLESLFMDKLNLFTELEYPPPAPLHTFHDVQAS